MTATAVKNSTAAHKLPETQRARRGHNFYPPKDIREATPELYATDGQPFAEKTVVLHYFGGPADWYIVEANWETGEAFGYADLGSGEGEWGYIPLAEVEKINVRSGLLIMERDLYFEPKPFGEIRS